jgi:protein-S-isoprenylcysteine O-methyltransferase Ste14
VANEKSANLISIIKLVLRVVIFVALVFLLAGTVYWPEAWLLFAIYFVFAAYTLNWMRKNSPHLLEERAKIPVEKGQPTWDKIWVVIFGVTGFLWFAALGLDYRYGWSAVPLWLKAIGFLGLVPALYWLSLVIKTNAFLSPEVKVQKGHKVISTGPYRVVRHPHYAAIITIALCVSLGLGSYYSFILAALISLHLAIRIHFEEKKLAKELPGYKEYMKKTKYRLVPGIW